MSHSIESVTIINNIAKEIEDALECSKDEALKLMEIEIQSKQLKKLEDLHSGINDMVEKLESIDFRIKIM